MNKIKKIIMYILSIIVLALTIILTVTFGIKAKNSSDEISKYKLENPVLVKYDNFDDLLKVISGDEDAYYVYFGKPDCPYCQRYLPVVNEVMYNKNIPLLYFNAESIKGSHYDEEGRLVLNEEYAKVINWIKENSIVDAKANSWIGSKTENEQTVDWLMVPRFFKVEKGQITNCFKSFDEAESCYKSYEETKNEVIYTMFSSTVRDNYLSFMLNKAEEKTN